METEVTSTSTTDGGPVRLTIVVPTYREAENVPTLLERIETALRDSSVRWDAIIVDDNSADGIEECIAEQQRLGRPVRLVVRKDERGLSSAVIRGFREAEGDVLLCMDADLSHPPERIADMMARFREPGVDFVIGSRYVPGASTEEGWGVFRWLNSRGATLLARPLCRARDPMSGFFALRRETFQGAAPLDPVGYKIGLELMVKCRCRAVREVPIHFANRTRGQSKLSLREQVNYLRHIRRLANFRLGMVAQFLQFCLVGGAGAFVDLATYATLRAGGLHLYGARALAIWLAMTFNFALNRRLTFSYSRAGAIVPQYLRFVATCSVGALVNWSLSVLLTGQVEFFREHIFLAAVCGILAGTIFNFTASYLWAFRRQ